MVTCVLVTFLTGYSRYKTVKGLLQLKLEDIHENFERVGVGNQAKFLGVLLLGSSVLYCVGGEYQWFWPDDE